jgi:hypothetical protein
MLLLISPLQGKQFRFTLGFFGLPKPGKARYFLSYLLTLIIFLKFLIFPIFLF